MAGSRSSGARMIARRGSGAIGFDRAAVRRSGRARGAQVRWRALRPVRHPWRGFSALFHSLVSEVCMILRWSLAATALLAAGVAFAQNPGGTGASSSAAGSTPAAAQQQTPPAPITAADKPNLSYAIGFQIGNDF